MWLWITALIILIFTFFLLCPFDASFSYSHFEKENKTELIVKYLFLKKKIPIEKKQKSEDAIPEKKASDNLTDKGLKFYYNIYKVLKKDVFSFLDYLIKKAIVLQYIGVKTDFGCADAATTGVLTGTLNGIFYNVMAFFHNNFTLKDWEIQVNPDFETEKFNLYFDCIVRLKTVHIIAVALKGLKIYLKLKKELKKGRKK